jgi:hypothetical protein
LYRRDVRGPLQGLNILGFARVVFFGGIRVKTEWGLEEKKLVVTLHFLFDPLYLTESQLVSFKMSLCQDEPKFGHGMRQYFSFAPEYRNLNHGKPFIAYTHIPTHGARVFWSIANRDSQPSK